MRDEDIENEISEAHITEAIYNPEYASLEWAFDESRKVGDTYVEYDEPYMCYAAYMITSPAVRDMSATKTVRQILISADSYGSDAQAKQKVEQIYATWQEEGKS